VLSIHRRTVYLLIVISLGHVLLISAQVQSKAGLPLIQDLTFGAFARIRLATVALTHGVGGFWSHYLALHGAAEENDGLRRRIVELEGQVQQQRALLSRTQALEATLALQQSVPAPTLTARVIAGSPSPESLTVTIDRGAADGVVADMGVIAAEGVVGRVIGRPPPHAAQVQLIINRSAAVGVKFERTGASGVVRGRAGDPALHLEYVSGPGASDVKAGDRLVTSGIEGFYPQGFLVGTVDRVERSGETYRLITVRPAVNVSQLDVVLVLLAKPVPPSDPGPGKGGA
jgi:rod shape-determining protein MreC